MPLTHKKLAYLYGILAILCFVLGLVFASQLNRQWGGHFENITVHMSMPFYPILLIGIIWPIAITCANPVAFANNHYSLWLPSLIILFAIGITSYLLTLSFFQNGYPDATSVALMTGRRYLLSLCSLGSLCGAMTWHILCYQATRKSGNVTN